MAWIIERTTRSGECRWDVRWRVSGRTVRETCGSAWEAKNLLEEKRAREAKGRHRVDRPDGRKGFEDFARRWLDTRLVRGRPLSPTTRSGYEGLLRRNLLPHFGSVPLRHITPEAVRAWYTDLTEAAGRDQASKSYRLLHAILNTALDELDVYDRNPCRMKGAGTEEAGERPLVDVATVIALADAICPSLRAFVLLAGFGGLRTGEQLGLRRQDVDLDHGEVWIRQNAVNAPGQGRVVKAPKSEAGTRRVTIPTIALDALKGHMATYAQAGPEGFVFTSRRGQPINRQELSRRWRAAVGAVATAPTGLHPHDLRHHAATLAARMPGVTLAELMARIGHSSPRAALRYQHATARRDRAIASFLDAEIAAVATPVTR